MGAHSCEALAGDKVEWKKIGTIGLEAATTVIKVKKVATVKKCIFQEFELVGD